MKRHTILFIFSLVVICANAQNGVNSPYSRYGFGLLSDRSMGFNKGMAGVAQGFRDGQQINIANPASYSAVDSLTSLFDLGITLQNGNYKMGHNQQNVKNSSIDHVAFQFRAAKNIGITLGLMPVSNIKYGFASQNEVIPGTESTSSSYSYSGDGGLREIVLGAGYRPFNALSVGLNVSYLWGEYSHMMNMSFNESSPYSIRRKYDAVISTYNAQAGIQYIQKLSKKESIVVGATYTLGHNVNDNARMLTQTVKTVAGGYSSQSSVQTERIDTARNAFQLPHSFAVGVTYYHSNTLRVGADFELQKWSDCRFPVETANGSSTVYAASKGLLNDRTRIAAGLDWTPNPTTGKLLQSTTYKMGGYYSQSYANADNTGKVTDKPYEFGLTAGFSVPIRNRNANKIYPNTTRLNVSMQWVHTDIPYLNTATMDKSMLTENYLRLCIGLSINEGWFYKWKLQ